MKIAKASDRDFEAAYALLRLINSANAQWDAGLPGERAGDDDTPFDPDSAEDLARLWRILKGIDDSAPGGLSRVIFGMATVMDPKNGIVDQESDVLELAPRLRAVDEAQQQEYRELDALYQIRKIVEPFPGKLMLEELVEAVRVLKTLAIDRRPASDPPEPFRHVLITWPGAEQWAEGFMCGTGRWFRADDHRAREPMPVTWWAEMPAGPEEPTG